MVYILVLLSTLFLAFDFAIDKVYQLKSGNSMYSGFRYNLYVGIIGCFLFFCINGFSMRVTLFSAVISLACALIVAIYKILAFKIIERGSIAIYTISLMSGGMVVPYIWGIMFLKEPFTITKTAGLLVILIALVVAYYSKEKIDLRQLFLCVLIFFINGMSSVVSKYHQVQTVFEVVNATEFVILQNIARVLISGIILLFVKKEVKEDVKNTHLYVIFILAAIFGGFAGLFNVLSAKTVPATVLYPLITGGAIVFSVIAARIAFKEKITKNLLAGIILCVAGVVLFSV